MPLGAGVSKAKANWAGFGDPEIAQICAVIVDTVGSVPAGE